MSLEAIVWAWKRPVNDQSELLLLLALADYANQDNECWPGYERLMGKTRIRSRATLSKRLTGLEKLGLIERTKRPVPTGGSKSTVYRLMMLTESSEIELSRKFNFFTPNVQELNSPSTVNQSDRTSQSIYTDSFNFFWSNYPKRQGDQGNKKKTFQRYTKLLSAGFTDQQLTDSAIRYQRYCSSTGKLNTEYVKQTTTFLNDTSNIENLWTVNNENNQPANHGGLSKHETYADHIFNAPGCESLSAEDQASIFGERPVQNHGAEVANEVQEYVPAEHDGGR